MTTRLSLVAFLLVSASTLRAQFPPQGGDSSGFGRSRGGFGGPGGGSFDPSQFAGMAFDRAANGKPTITISEYTSRMDPEASSKLAEWARKNGNNTGQVTKDQFSKFFSERMAERQAQGGFRFGGPPGGGGGPPGTMTMTVNSGNGQPMAVVQGAPPAFDAEAFAKQRFEQSDLNKDGQLDQSEASDRLRASFAETDTDRNGTISLAEYTQFIRGVAAASNGGMPGGDPGFNPWGQPGFMPIPEEKKTAVYRFGALPKDLPDWFVKLDTDKDSQVGLYEWRRASRDLAEFRDFDINGDGLITVDEGLLPSRIAARKKDAALNSNSTVSTSTQGFGGGDDRGGRMRGGSDQGGDRPVRGDRPDRGGGGGDRPPKGDRPDRPERGGGKIDRRTGGN